MLSRRPALASLLFAALVACGTSGVVDPALTMNDAVTSSRANDAGAATVSTNPSAVPIRRLSAAEYDNTVRDLVGTNISFSATFPAETDERATNVAADLTTSPALEAAYDAAAERLASVAVDNPKIVTCDPAVIGHVACATDILSRFAMKAWRRPITREELDVLVSAVRDAEAAGASFTTALQTAVKATLVSVSFLFHVESDSDSSSSVPHALSEYELASRLSYFLWSTMPDDVLFAYANAGRLSEAATFEREVARMLADPRATALAQDFASAWLLRTFPDATPDPGLFPTFDDDLRASMTAETQAMLATFLFDDRSFLDIVDAPFTFLDGRLADYYGVPGITGTRLVQIPVWPGTHRGGLLTQGSVLTMTAKSTRTSPDRRGEWVLAELLCAPNPPSPATDPALPSDASAAATRESLREMGTSGTCATCHAAMDPFGFTLEHYNAIGRWRDTDQGAPIDATGTLPAGTTVDGAAALAATIKADARFPACATQKLFTYALGRAPTTYDEPALAALLATFVQGGHRMRDLVLALVHADAFRTRHGGT